MTNIIEFGHKYSSRVQVICIPQDYTLHAYNACLAGKSSFLTIPFHHNQRRKTLVDKYKVVALPTVIILSHEGKVVTDWGRSAIVYNEDGCVDAWEKGDAGITNTQLGVGVVTSCSIM